MRSNITGDRSLPANRLRAGAWLAWRRQHQCNNRAFNAWFWRSQGVMAHFGVVSAPSTAAAISSLTCWDAVGAVSNMDAAVC